MGVATGSTKTAVFHRCVPGGIRTPNLLIRSQKLYPVELQARFVNPKTQASNPNRRNGKFGIWDLRSRVADGTRTRNNQNHNLGLYH
jgi:hypothetical protein